MEYIPVNLLLIPEYFVSYFIVLLQWMKFLRDTQYFSAGTYFRMWWKKNTQKLQRL